MANGMLAKSLMNDVDNLRRDLQCGQNEGR